jgi:hypothetical protein
LVNRDSIWVVVDRRLSYGGRRPPVDDTVKVMVLETIDGYGLLAYAGLGATPGGTEPSAWMSAALRGRGELTFGESLSVLADVASRELPAHLRWLRVPAHVIVAPAIVMGVGPRQYTIDSVLRRATGMLRVSVSSQQLDAHGQPALRIMLAGSGGEYLYRRRDTWRRPFLNLANAHDRGKISDYAFADHLAAINYEVHQNVSATVGPRCIVAWHRRPGYLGPLAGGAQQFYNGRDRDGVNNAIPTISHGMDMQAIANLFMERMRTQRAAHPNDRKKWVEIDNEEMNRQLAELPEGPDERLR